MTDHAIRIPGRPTPRQALFFASRTRFTAYGGARGGGKSWALRRKLVAMCLRYEGLRCLLLRLTMSELRANHLLPFLKEYGQLVEYREADHLLRFPNGSGIFLGYCACDRDVLRYQGQEYDVIAIDEATQMSEHIFLILKASLRGTRQVPRRMYLTCNPGGVGHAWVKRLFVDREFRSDERPEDYSFIPAFVYDNPILMEADPDYARSLESLPPRLREAWLYGKWDVFEGQFFPEFDPSVHVLPPAQLPRELQRFVAIDYGFDMLAALLMGEDDAGNLFVLREHCEANLTLSEAAERISRLCFGEKATFAVASPDLWNRRQDSGRSGFELMQRQGGMPPMLPADDRRIPGWRMLRNYLQENNSHPHLRISSACGELIHSLPALLCHRQKAEDAAGEPHRITHAPEALRYGVMSRCPVSPTEQECLPFRFSPHGSSLWP
ncbi:MAG: phage terminase large subunit [Clostridia bacterium]|nr:phage terminase large subunit [Clostridia bacterium]